MKRILDNLEDFTKQLVDFIANNTEQGHLNLLDVFAKASDEYDKPKKSYLWSWVYSYSRIRSEAFAYTMQKLNAFPDPITRLKAFKEFVSTGGWTSTSANMDLFKALIEAIPGYEKEDEVLLTETIIPRLNQLLIGVIDPLITQFERARQEREAREKELTAMRREKMSALEHLEVFVDEPLAIKFAQENPSKTVFHLAHNGNHWQLCWLDARFKSTPLDISLELDSLLNSIKGASILDALPDKLNKIKEHCLQAMDRLLHKVKFIISPSGYLQPNLVSTFTIVGDSGQYSLDWYDSLGKRKPIDLSKYPSLEGWLKELSCIYPFNLKVLVLSSENYH